MKASQVQKLDKVTLFTLTQVYNINSGSYEDPVQADKKHPLFETLVKKLILITNFIRISSSFKTSNTT